jgi:hypothetical protein
MAIQMAACNQIIGYLDDLLDSTAHDDYGPNGLQVPGTEPIQTVVTVDGPKPIWEPSDPTPRSSAPGGPLGRLS